MLGLDSVGSPLRELGKVGSKERACKSITKEVASSLLGQALGMLVELNSRPRESGTDAPAVRCVS